MIITFSITILFLGVLLLLSGISIYVAWSGYLPGRTHIGWILLSIYAAIYLTFVFGWLARIPGLFSSVYSIILLVLFPASQIPLLIRLLAQAILPDPTRGLKVLAVHSEAESKVNQDDLAGAIQAYEKVVVKDSDDVSAHFRLAELYYQNQDYRKAVKAYAALSKQPKKMGMSQDCLALTRLSDIFAQNLGDIESARRHVQTIIDRYPDTTYARYAIDRLDRL